MCAESFEGVVDALHPASLTQIGCLALMNLLVAASTFATPWATRIGRRSRTAATAATAAALDAVVVAMVTIAVGRWKGRFDQTRRCPRRRICARLVVERRISEVETVGLEELPVHCFHIEAFHFRTDLSFWIPDDFYSSTVGKILTPDRNVLIYLKVDQWNKYKLVVKHSKTMKEKKTLEI